MIDWLARLTRPRWLFYGPKWWRAANAWWLKVWGRLFWYRNE